MYWIVFLPWNINSCAAEAAPRLRPSRHSFEKFLKKGRRNNNASVGNMTRSFLASWARVILPFLICRCNTCQCDFCQQTLDAFVIFSCVNIAAVYILPLYLKYHLTFCRCNFASVSQIFSYWFFLAICS